MKTLILIVILIFISYFAFKSLYLTLTGRKGCSCSSSKKGNCPYKEKCNKT